MNYIIVPQSSNSLTLGVRNSSRSNDITSNRAAFVVFMVSHFFNRFLENSQKLNLKGYFNFTNLLFVPKIQSIIHPKIKKTPPIGVIIPMIGNSVNASRYRLPEKNIIPNKKE